MRARRSIWRSTQLGRLHAIVPDWAEAKVSRQQIFMAERGVHMAAGISRVGGRLVREVAQRPEQSTTLIAELRWS